MCNDMVVKYYNLVSTLGELGACTCQVQGFWPSQRFGKTTEQLFSAQTMHIAAGRTYSALGFHVTTLHGIVSKDI